MLLTRNKTTQFPGRINPRQTKTEVKQIPTGITHRYSTRSALALPDHSPASETNACAAAAPHLQEQSVCWAQAGQLAAWKTAGTALQSWVPLCGCSQHSNKSPRGHKDNPRASQDEIPRGERKVFIHIRHSVPLANKEDETKAGGKVKSCSKHRAAAQQSLPAPGSAAGCEHCRTAQLCASTSQHPVLGVRFT